MAKNSSAKLMDSLSLETFTTIVTAISAIAIPVLVAFLANSYTRALKEREIQAQFVKIAVDILQSPPTEANRNVRDWATQIINRYSGVPLSAEAKRDLIERVPITAITAIEFGRKFSEKLPTDEISKAQKDLKGLGFYNNEITGIADVATIEAIIAFQKSEKIVPDGALGMQTKSKLRERATKTA